MHTSYYCTLFVSEFIRIHHFKVEPTPGPANFVVFLDPKATPTPRHLAPPKTSLKQSQPGTRDPQLFGMSFVSVMSLFLTDVITLHSAQLGT